MCVLWNEKKKSVASFSTEKAAVWRKGEWKEKKIRIARSRYYES